MLSRNRVGALLVAALALLGMLATGAAIAAGGKVKNGNFEKGTFKNWQRANDGAQGGVYLYDRALYANPGGAPDPLSFLLAEKLVPPPRGDYSPVFAQSGPGNRALWRVIKLPKNAKSLSLRTFWNNLAEDWIWTGDFAYDGPSNEFFTIDLLKVNASPLSADGPSLLKKLFRPGGGTPLDSGGWQKVTAKVRKLAGKKVLLRVAEVDNQDVLAVGLDDVKIKKKKKKRR